MTAAVQINFPPAPQGTRNAIDTVAELRAIDSTDVDLNTEVLVAATGFFKFEPSSLTADDGSTVIKPNNLTNLQAGRWLITLVTSATVIPSSGGTVQTDLDKLFAAAQAQLQRVMEALKNNDRNVNIVLLGDSTGDATNEWFYLLAVTLSALWPAFGFRYRPWDTGTKTYPAGSEIAISSGTGAFTATFWNASIAGTAANEFAGAGFNAAVAQIANLPGGLDLLFMNYSHNGSLVASNQANFLTAVTTRAARTLPGVPIVVIGQNPEQSGGVDTGTIRPKVDAYRTVCAQEGLGFIDVHGAFLQSGISLSTLVPDGVHPGATGSALWAATVAKAFVYASGIASGPAQSRTAPRLLRTIWNYGDLHSRASLAGTAVLAPTTVSGEWETGGRAAKLTTSAGSGWMTISGIVSADVVALYGRPITVLVRVLVAEAQPLDAGRIQLTDGVNTVDSEFGGPQGTDFYDIHLTLPAVSSSSTGINLVVYGSSSSTASQVIVDRIVLTEGVIAVDYIPSDEPVLRRLTLAGNLYGQSGSADPVVLLGPALGAAIASLTATATAGSLPVANGAVTIANAASPTVLEVQEFCMELKAVQDAILARMRAATPSIGP